MKQYTHGWIGMMGVKRLDHAQFAKPEAREVATNFVDWIDEYRDNLIKGAWYPDEVIKDMSTGHILKPLHGDDRQYAEKLNLHADIEEYWDKQMKNCFRIDKRFLCFQ